MPVDKTRPSTPVLPPRREAGPMDLRQVAVILDGSPKTQIILGAIQREMNWARVPGAGNLKPLEAMLEKGTISCLVENLHPLHISDQA